MDTDAPLPPKDLQEPPPAQTTENPPQKQEETPQISFQEQIIAAALKYRDLRVPSVATADELGTQNLEWAGMCPYFPVGKLTVLAGYPGVGKTAIALAVAADVTTKYRRNVLYISREDTISDTLLPRFRNAFGNTRHLIFCNGYLDGPDKKGNRKLVRTIIPHTWIRFLGCISGVAKPKLIVFDPLPPLYSGNSIAREEKAREEIGNLVSFAFEHDCAILLIAHLKRCNNRTAIDQIRDNSVLANAARSILLAGELTSEPGAYAMVHVKSNLTERGPSLKYVFEDGAFDWRGEIRAHSDDILPYSGRDNTTPGLMTAKMYLVEKLRHGPANVEDIKHGAPCSNATLIRAKAALGVSSMKSKVANGQWYWCLKSINPAMDLHDYYEV